MQNLFLIKLGGSVITNKKKAFTIREANIKRLAKEIKDVQKKFRGKIIIGHGAGSFAHTPAKKYRTKEGLINKDSLMGMTIVEDAARRLNMVVIKNFLQEKIPVFSFSPASFMTSDVLRGGLIYIDPIIKSLELGIIPVVYGDVVMDSKTGFTIFSTEKVLASLVSNLKKKYKIKIIYCTDVDGVYDSKGKTIPKITKKSFPKLKKMIQGAKTVDVTGGMLNKVEESLDLAAKTGIEIMILNGSVKNELKNAILGKKTQSTVIVS